MCLISLLGSKAQTDSIQLIINNGALDTNEAKTIIRLQAKQFSDGEFQKILQYRSKVLALTSELDNQVWYAQCVRLIGVALERTGKIDSAIIMYEKTLEIAKTLGRKRLEAQCYHNIGFGNYLQSSFDNAIVAYLNAIKIREELKDSVPLAWSLNNTGLIYWRQHSKQDALKHFIHAREIFRKKNYLEGLAMSTSNVGLIYDELNDKVKAKQYYFEAYQINSKIENKEGIALTLNNLSEIYRNIGQMDTCILFLNKALEINKEINNLEGMDLNYRNLADISRVNKEYKKALELINKAIEVSKQGDLPQGLIANYRQLSLIHADMGNYKDAFFYHQYFAKLNDSLNFGDKLATLEAAFGKEKMEKEVSRLKNEKEIADLQLKQKEWLMYSAAIGFIILVIISFIIIRSNILRKRINRSLEIKNIEITNQKAIIEGKSKDITDSILYAKRIQSAVLPEMRDFKSLFPDHFVLFEPRDIVSGDFYWLDNIDGKIILILADCTGHGVPGAFMSIIGHDLLNQIIKEEKRTNPAEILSELDFKLFQILNKNNSSNNDGMDIAVCSFDTQSRKLQFCGAGRPLISYNGEELRVYNGHKFSIGGATHTHTKIYTNTEISYKEGNVFYLTSDGFSDQFGGEKGKKFKTKKLIETLKNLKGIPMENQKELLLDTFAKWKGELEQVDDVCILGVSF